MDELGKVKRVVEKQAPVTEVLLVLDATTGQNGLTQARVFCEVVDVTGIVLTKLDGSAKGGIVVAVQRELGVPVKLVGLGEGADDLAPFDPSGVRRRAARRELSLTPARGRAADHEVDEARRARWAPGATSRLIVRTARMPDMNWTAAVTFDVDAHLAAVDRPLEHHRVRRPRPGRSRPGRARRSAGRVPTRRCRCGCTPSPARSSRTRAPWRTLSRRSPSIAAGVGVGICASYSWPMRRDGEVLLLGPAAVDGRLAHAGPGGDVVDGHVVEPVREDQRGGRVEDAAVGLGVAGAASLAAHGYRLGRYARGSVRRGWSSSPHEGMGSDRAVRRVLRISAVHVPVTRIAPDVTRTKHPGRVPKHRPTTVLATRRGSGPRQRSRRAPPYP